MNAASLTTAARRICTAQTIPGNSGFIPKLILWEQVFHLPGKPKRIHNPNNRRNATMYETTILSVQQTTFKGKDGEPDRIMWKVYCADSTGAVGCIYSMKERKAGEMAQLDLVVNRDGRFTAKLLDPPAF